MPSDFLKTTLLFHPNGGESKMLGSSSIWHFSAPYDGFTSSHDDGVTVNSDIFDVPIVRSDH
jgi:hypothetical protein